MPKKRGMERTFTLDYWKDGDWYVGKLREVPGVFSQGKTLQELVSNIIEVYKLMVEEGTPKLPTRTFKTTEVAIPL